jgi:FkbM family methyltransferase
VVRNLLTEDSIVYSFGVGEDITFDLALIEQYGLNVYAFDPTPLAIKFVEKANQLTNQFHFEDIGISDKDEVAKFYLSTDKRDISGSIINKNDDASFIEVEMNKVSTIMKKLNHTRIDLLKMDIEGSEYAVLENMLEEKNFPKQILVEFHHRFPQIEKNQTKKIIQKLNDAGYKIAKISDVGLEYTFLH